MIHIEHFTFNSFQTSCYVVWDDSLSCAIIDPGCASENEAIRITSFVERKGLNPACIMLTHGHFDHILGVAGLAGHYGGIPVFMHPDDKFTLENNEYFCRAFGAPMPESFHILIEIGEIWVVVNRLELRSPAIMGSKHLCQSGLSAADVTCNRYMHII